MSKGVNAIIGILSMYLIILGITNLRYAEPRWINPTEFPVVTIFYIISMVGFLGVLVIILDRLNKKNIKKNILP